VRYAPYPVLSGASICSRAPSLALRAAPEYIPAQQWLQRTYCSPDYLGGGECETLMTDTVDLTVLGRRIERMDDQLHGIVNRLDRIEGSIAIVDSHVGTLTAEVHRFGERLDRYDERFDRLEQLLRDRPAPS
jgi:hypothetical protein